MLDVLLPWTCLRIVTWRSCFNCIPTQVICTTCDPRSWWASIAPIESANWSLRALLFYSVPKFHYFATYARTLDRTRRKELHQNQQRPEIETDADGEEEKFVFGPHVYAQHLVYVQRVVPEQKLFFYDIKTYWGPLCAILDVPLPKDLKGEVLAFPGSE